MEPNASSRADIEDGSAALGIAPAEWKRLRTRLLQELRRRIRADAETLEDLAQEACVRLIRALRRDPQLQPDAYVRVVAQRTGADYLRSLYRHQRLIEAVGRGELDAALPHAVEPSKGELLERLELVVVELLDKAQASECKELALAWFNGVSWSEWAHARQLEHAAVRKRWSRCLDRVRQSIEADPHWGAVLRWSVRS
jgi:RNA polymerase sigma factor (sigma-70 family)